MNKRSYRFTLLLFLLSIGLKAQAQNNQLAKNELKVLSWNIQMLPNALAVFSKALQKKQAFRARQIVNYLDSMDFDVIAFQELFDQDIKKFMIRRLRHKYPYIQKTKTKVGKLTSNGLMLFSNIPMKYLDHNVYVHAALEDKWAAKGAVLVELNWKGQNIQICNTHLQAWDSPKAIMARNEQLKEVRALIEKNQDDSLAMLILGDLNTPRQDTVNFKQMLARLMVQDIPLNEHRPFTYDPQNSWNEGEPIQLDYIFFDKKRAAIQASAPRLIRPLSQYKGVPMDLADHYGIYLKLKMDE